jgi:hypothetical protein
MPEDLKRFEAVLGEWVGLEFRIITLVFAEVYRVLEALNANVI